MTDRAKVVEKILALLREAGSERAYQASVAMHDCPRNVADSHAREARCIDAALRAALSLPEEGAYGRCTCGLPGTLGVVHRFPSPCYMPDPPTPSPPATSNVVPPSERSGHAGSTPEMATGNLHGGITPPPPASEGNKGRRALALLNEWIEEGDVTGDTETWTALRDYFRTYGPTPPASEGKWDACECGHPFRSHGADGDCQWSGGCHGLTRCKCNRYVEVKRAPPVLPASEPPATDAAREAFTKAALALGDAEDDVYRMSSGSPNEIAKKLAILTCRDRVLAARRAYLATLSGGERKEPGA